MARIIKAPNVKEERPYRVVERSKVLMHADDEAAAIIESATQQEHEILSAAADQAEGIINDATQEAGEIIAQAQTEADEVKSQAFDQGYQEGLNQGLVKAKQQVAGLLEELKNMIALGQKMLEEAFLAQEEDIRLVICDVAGRVIQQKIEIDDEIVVRNAKECIHMAADRMSVRVLVHPDDQAKIQEWAPEFTRMFDDIDKITVETDPRVSPGGVIVESGAGGIDGRIDKQKEILTKTLLNP